MRDEQTRIIIPGEEDGESGRSSGTVGDGEGYHFGLLKDTAPPQSSSSTIEDIEKQDRDITQTDQADRPSIESTRDLEKGETNSKEDNGVDQVGEDNRQTLWENDVVGWDGPNDPQNPQNWKKSKKYIVTVFYSSLTFCITFASTVFSTATMVTAKEFGVSSEVMTLGTSVFVFVSAHSQLHPSKTNMTNRVLLLAQ